MTLYPVLVPGKGPTPCDRMIVGEAPWLTEIEAGEPFVGDAGDTLDDWLSSHVDSRRDLYITNAFKGEIGPVIRPPRPEELWDHFPLLVYEIASVRPTCILALGGTATRVLLPHRMQGRSARLGSVVSRWYRMPISGIRVYPCYHPSRPKTAQQLQDVREQLRRFFA